MKANRVFGIIVRTVGLLLSIHSLSSFQLFMTMHEGFGQLGISRGALIIGFLIEATLGLNLLFNARPIVRFAYRRPAQRPAHESPRKRKARPNRPAEAPGAPDFEKLGDALGENLEPN